jgi:hypothetical protein
LSFFLFGEREGVPHFGHLDGEGFLQTWSLGHNLIKRIMDQQREKAKKLLDQMRQEELELN